MRDSIKRARIVPVLILLAISAGFAALGSGCGPSVGPGSAWTDPGSLPAALRPEISPAPPEEPPERSPGDTLRIATYNVHYGEDVGGIADAIRGDDALSRADVLYLQEIRALPDERSTRASRLARALGMAYAYAPAKELEGGGTHGLAILSRFPLANVSVMELPAGELVVDNERRIALTAEIRVAGARIHLVNVHLDTRLNAGERILQLRPAVLDAAAPAVVAGDFNTNPLTWAGNMVPVLPGGASGATDQAPVLDDYMRSIGMTTPTARFGATVDFPMYEPRLDSVYLRGLEHGDGAVERDVTASDHWPLWVDVVVPEGSNRSSRKNAASSERPPSPALE